MARSSKKNRFVPHVESFESRDLMSITSVSLVGGVLNIKADSANDKIHIKEIGIDTKTTTNGTLSSSLSTNIVMVPTVNVVVTDQTKTANNVWTFSKSSITKINVDLGAGNDILDSTGTSLAMAVFAGAGHDNIYTGSGADFVSGGLGNDTIFTNGGADTIQGDDGNDLIKAGAGDDFVNGGLGSDTVFGEAGNDIIKETISSLVDSNVFLGEGDNDIITSFNKNDWVDGGAGIDTLNVKAGSWGVKNGEKVVIDAPLGTVSNVAGSGINAANRFLRSYGLSPLTVSTTPSSITPAVTLKNLIAAKRPETTIQHNVLPDQIAALVLQGKPVIVLAVINGAQQYILVNGFDSVAGIFFWIDLSGAPKSGSKTTFKNTFTIIFLKPSGLKPLRPMESKNSMGLSFLKRFLTRPWMISDDHTQ